MRQTIHLAALSLVNIGLTFAFQWYALTQLGPGQETDALFVGMTVPQLVLAVISSSLMHVLVPLLAGERQERLSHDAWGFLILVVMLFGGLTAVLYATAVWWVPWTVPGFDGYGRQLAIELTQIQLIGMIFSAANGVQWAAYHARHRFIWAEAAPVLSSLMAFGVLVWALPRFGVQAAAWAGVLRVFMQTLLLSPGMGRPQFPDFSAIGLDKAWQRIRPLLVGTVYYKTDSIVDRFLLSSASSGSLSLYYLAQQIYGAAGQVLNRAVAAPLVPLLSTLHKSGKRQELLDVYRHRLKIVAVVSVVGASVLMVSGQEILAIVIGYGNVDSNDIADLWWLLVGLLGVFVGGIGGQICSSSFYACGDTVTPTRISIVSYTVYVPAKIASYYVWGVMGLALTTSVYYMANFLLQAYFFKKERP